MSFYSAGRMARFKDVCARRRPLCSASIVALALSPMPALATAFTWSGGSSDYGTSTNWTPNGVPGAGDNVTYSSSGLGTVNLAAPFSANGWTFSAANNQFYTITGSAITIGSGGIIDNSVNELDTIANNILGTGGVTQNGNFKLVLSGTNSYSGATTISAGTLQIGAGGTSGTLGTNSVTDNGTLAFNRTDTIIVSNAISGTGGLTQLGTGTTILSGTNTGLSGSLTISAGTLQIGNGGANGAVGSGAITDNAALIFNLSANTTVANSITGTGSLTQAGTGVLSLTNTNGYVNTTINAGSILQLSGNSATLGSGTVTDNGTLLINRTGAYNQVAVISGTGGLTVANTGTVTIQTAQAYSGTTTINSGATLALSDLGAIASSSVNDVGTFNITLITPASTSIAALTGAGSVITTGGGFTKSLTISNASGIFSGTISGGGAVTIAGGTQVFNSAQTYTGGTTIASGAILTFVANGSVAGAIVDNGTLAYGSTGTVTLTSFAGITGSGGIAEVGGGTLIVDTQVPLTGISSVTSGTLIVGDANTPTASLAGGVLVASGATLEGHGTINGAVNVLSGGSLKAGASIGNLTVNGTVSLPAGTTFTEEFSNTAFSKLAASGQVTLGGTLALVSDSTTYTPGTDYKFITGSSVSGAFSAVTGSITGYTTNVQYSANAVDLIITPSGSTPAVINTFLFNTYGRTPNQIAAGAALTANASSAPLYVALGAVVQNNVAAVPATLGQLAGDIHASIRSAAIEDSRVIRDTVLNRLDAAAGTNVWGTVFGGYGSIATDNNADALHHDASGAIVGADMAVTDNLRLGGAFAYSSANASTLGKFSAAKGKIAHLMAYAGYQEDALDLKAGATYDFGNLRIARNIANLNYSETDGQTQKGAQIFASGGWKFSTDAAMVEPYAQIAAISATSGAFAESGSIGALSGSAKTDSETYSTLGLKASLANLTLGDDMAILPKIDLGWQNVNQSFPVLGLPLSTDAAAVQIGFDLTVAPGVTVNAGYDGSFSSRVQNNALRLSLGMAL